MSVPSTVITKLAGADGRSRFDEKGKRASGGGS